MDGLSVNVRVVLVVAQTRLCFRNRPISASVQDNFGAATVVSDGPLDAKLTVMWNHSDLNFVPLPNDSSKGLIGVRPVEINKRWNSAKLRRGEALSDLAANGFLFANMLGSLRRWNTLSDGKDRSQQERQQECSLEQRHRVSFGRTQAENWDSEERLARGWRNYRPVWAKLGLSWFLFAYDGAMWEDASTMLPRGPERCTTARLVFAFLLFLLFSPIVAEPQVFDFEKDRVPMADLNGLMRFHTGDDPHWANPNFDDSHWPLIRSDQDWGQQGYKGYGGIAWYRFRILLPRDEIQLALYLPAVWTSYQVFEQGQLIGQVGQLPPHGKAFSGARKVYLLPAARGSDGSVTVALRIWHPAESARFFGGGLWGVPVIGAAETIQKEQTLQLKAKVWELSSPSLQAEIEILACVGAIILFFIRRRDREYFWFAAYEGFSGMQQLIDNYWVFHTKPYVLRDIADTSLSFAAPICILLFIYTVFGSKWSPIYWIMAAIASLVFCFQLALNMGAEVPFDSVLVIAPLGTAYSILLLVLLVRGARRRNVDAIVLLVSDGLYTCFSTMAIVAYLFSMFNHPGLVDVFDWTKPRMLWPFPISLGDLCNTLVDLSLFGILILRFARSRRDEERFKAELESARIVQQVLVPAEIPEIPGYGFEAIYKPAGQVGGDFFQIVSTRDGGALVVIGDVSGKGMPAAMTVSLLVGTVRTLAHYVQSPGEILSAMNQRMLARSKDGFTTCLVVRLESNGSVIAANAGHLAPYVDGREIGIRSGLPLGLLSGAEYEETVFTFTLGQQLTLMTDGVVEAQSKNKELFGFERAAGIARESASRVAESAVSFGQQDDITVVTVRRVEVKAAESVEFIGLTPSES
jgi:sigma-B regulation protein RsbU (phosphoserine phosphatase)